MSGMISPAVGAPALIRFRFVSGYNNTTTTIKLGTIVAYDILNTTDGAGFVPCATSLYGGIAGVALETIAPGGGTASTGEYTDRIVMRGTVLALVQLTSGGVAPGDKLIPAAGGVLNWSAAAAAAVSQPNFTYAGLITTTTDLALCPVVVNL